MAVDDPATAIESQVIASSPTHRRIIGLDGVRGLGCLAVVVGHVGEWYTPHTHHKALLDILGLALILFFVLSGFLLFLPYVRNLAKPQGHIPNTRQYALHRIFRVFPGYLVIFLICNFILRATYIENPAIQPRGTQLGSGMITDPGELLANLTLVQTYIPQYMQTGINPSWSLTLELAFYISLPLLGMLMFALRGRVRMHPLLLSCLAPAILLAVAFVGRAFIPLVYANVNVHNYVPVPGSDINELGLQNWGPNIAAVFTRSLLTNADLFRVRHARRRAVRRGRTTGRLGIGSAVVAPCFDPCDSPRRRGDADPAQGPERVRHRSHRRRVGVLHHPGGVAAGLGR